MLFNSVEFFIFFTIVFCVYWFLLQKNLRAQNLFLLLGSYVFYGFWDYRFLFLLAFSTWLDFFTGIKIYEASNKKSKLTWLLISVLTNLSFLGIFKYYNFFITSFASFFGNFGFKIDVWTLNVILPVGISFYTFHGLSYVFDIYNNKITPNRNVVDYSLFVSFFPLLVAGPIERATHLLPQIVKSRFFDYQKAVDGSRQILWGFFKKVVIADNCAPLVNDIFANYTTASGSELIIGAILFAFQIYGDFSGYSDIAIGTAKLLGIDLIRNFNFPYFSRDIAEFWRRWHISLSSWFRDYLYIPLGGSKGGRSKSIRNVFIIFIVSGFWHGANWTFIIWGALNALYFLPLMLADKNRENIDAISPNSIFPSFRELRGILLTFILTCLAWIFFRAPDVSTAIAYISHIFTTPFTPVSLSVLEEYKTVFSLIVLMICVEWIHRNKRFGLDLLGSFNAPVRWGIYFGIVLLLLLFAGSQQDFIYFQF